MYVLWCPGNKSQKTRSPCTTTFGSLAQHKRAMKARVDFAAAQAASHLRPGHTESNVYSDTGTPVSANTLRRLHVLDGTMKHPPREKCEASTQQSEGQAPFSGDAVICTLAHTSFTFINRFSYFLLLFIDKCSMIDTDPFFFFYQNKRKHLRKYFSYE